MKYLSLVIILFSCLSCQEGINYNKLGNNLIYWDEAKLEMVLPPDYIPYKDDANIDRDSFEAAVKGVFKNIESPFLGNLEHDYAAYTHQNDLIFITPNPRYFLLLDRYLDDFETQLEEVFKAEVDSLVFKEHEIFVTRRIKVGAITGQLNQDGKDYEALLYVVNYSDERKSLFILSVSKEPLDLKPYVKSIRFTEAPATAI